VGVFSSLKVRISETGCGREEGIGGEGLVWCSLSADEYVVGSVICATATSSAMLIFGRAFLGLGAAGLLQGALGIISHIVPLEKVPMYQGFVAGSAAVSATAGPVIGGALTDSVGWSKSHKTPYMNRNVLIYDRMVFLDVRQTYIKDV
jgi:MFS family permease